MGDLAELEGLPDDSPLLPMVTSTAENCLGSECPFWNECFVVQARQRAQNADVVVVNHHLLLADLALKQEGFGEILPGAQRSEEHTSELQSLMRTSYAVFCLKKKKTPKTSEYYQY